MARMLLGRKIGMTQIFDQNGKRIPVTVVQFQPNYVVRKKSVDGKDGYNAIQIATEGATRQEKDGQVRFRGLTRGQVGVFKAAGIAPQRFVRELRFKKAAELDAFEVGQALNADLFKVGDIIDAAGISKGRGYTGVMKRHNFGGFKMSHGVHESHRGGGSIGTSATPSRVLKGVRMAGQHGNVRVTVQNLKVVRVLEEDNAILIKGAIPGAMNSLVEITNAIKKSKG